MRILVFCHLRMVRMHFFWNLRHCASQSCLYFRTINIWAQMALERGEDLAKKNPIVLLVVCRLPKKIQPTIHASSDNRPFIVQLLWLSGSYFFFCQQDHVSTMAINSLWFHSWHLWLLTKVSRQLTRQKRAKYILYYYFVTTYTRRLKL